MYKKHFILAELIFVLESVSLSSLMEMLGNSEVPPTAQGNWRS